MLHRCGCRLAPFRLIPYFRKVKMPMLGTHNGYAPGGIFVFD